MGRIRDLRITEAGLRVLRGQDDYIVLNGTDRWLGGVHVADSEAACRVVAHFVAEGKHLANQHE